jgi:uncharacterized protein YyaL (SSP411 family)
MQHTNRLAKETSPYLLQHAHNPVDWYPWGDEALNKARSEDKPILISIGYSSCHWCHVMERESFENEATADIMNKHFINIKIDREERPDLDHIYMDAVQAMAGNGGWPLNVFLTPDLKPFYGGTYYPPVKLYNRASWKDVLYGVADAFKNKRDEIEVQSNTLVAHLQNANSFGTEAILKIVLPVDELIPANAIDDLFAAIMKQADEQWGGFGNAPKFPQTFIIRFLLQHYHFTRNKEALAQACLSLDKMIEGGIYDHAGGGFARYSTDTEWLAPHFEKMLYDNALLVIALSDAYQITKNELYKNTIADTLAFVEREMTSPEFGFYAALDADTEGVEGKFYTWQKKEVDEILKEDAELFCSYYDVTEKGNWEEVNIMRTKLKATEFCNNRNLGVEAFLSKMKNCLSLLLKSRNERVRPLLDDKIILSWNALMNMAYSKAFAATGVESYREMSKKNMNFLKKAFQQPRTNTWQHVYKSGIAKYNAFLDDYAFLIQALISIQHITSDTDYLLQAKQLTETVIELFEEAETGYFFYTPAYAQNIVIRKKEVYDGAIPSGNSVMATNLHYLGVVFNKQEWIQQSIQMLGSLQQAVIRYPVSFGVWAGFLYNLKMGYKELAIVGEGYESARDQVISLFIPNMVLQAKETGSDDFPLLSGKTPLVETPNFYLCNNYCCAAPVSNIADFMHILGQNDN